MRSLAVYLKNYKKESILAPFFKFLEVVFDLIVPIVIAQIIDVGIANHDNKYIVQRFFILILMAALGLASSITAQFFAAKASVGFATKLRQAVYDKANDKNLAQIWNTADIYLPEFADFNVFWNRVSEEEKEQLLIVE